MKQVAKIVFVHQYIAAYVEKYNEIKRSDFLKGGFDIFFDVATVITEVIHQHLNVFLWCGITMAENNL